MIPISIKQVKPCLDSFPLFPGKDTQAMRDAGMRYVSHVFEDAADARLAGSKSPLFRLIAFQADARAAANLPPKGHADYDIEALAAEIDCSPATAKEYIRQLVRDGLLFKYKRIDGRRILVIADDAGCTHLRGIMLAEQAKRNAPAAKVAARQARYAATAALRAKAKVPSEPDPEVPADPEPAAAPNPTPAAAENLAFFVAEIPKIFCAKAQDFLGVRRFSLAEGPTKTAESPTFFGGFLSKNGVPITLPINFLKTSSSSHLKRPCVDSGGAQEDDDVFASLFAGEELPSRFQDSDAPAIDDDPFGDDPFGDTEVPAVTKAEVPAVVVVKPAPVPQDADEAYDGMMREVIEEFGPISKIEPQVFRDSLAYEFSGASPATRNRVLKEVLRRFHVELAEGRKVGHPWGYFKKMLVTDIAIVKKVHDEAPKVFLLPAKPKAAMTQAMWDIVNPQWLALSTAEQDALVAETKTYLTPSQIAVPKAVIRQAKDLFAQRLGYPVEITWKSSD